MTGSGRIPENRALAEVLNVHPLQDSVIAQSNQGHFY